MPFESRVQFCMQRLDTGTYRPCVLCYLYYPPITNPLYCLSTSFIVRHKFCFKCTKRMSLMKHNHTRPETRKNPIVVAIMWCQSASRHKGSELKILGHTTVCYNKFIPMRLLHEQLAQKSSYLKGPFERHSCQILLVIESSHSLSI